MLANVLINSFVMRTLYDELVKEYVLYRGSKIIHQYTA